MRSSNYPLEQLIEIKENRLDQALKTLEEKREILAQEEKKLVKLEQERDDVLKHKLAKLHQLREELDKGTTTDKIQQMKNYLNVVNEKLLDKENKVKEQKDKVDYAKKQVEIAKQQVFEKQKDVDKLHLHKEEWMRERNQFEIKKESLEQDEIGSAIFQIKKKKKN